MADERWSSEGEQPRSGFETLHNSRFVLKSECQSLHRETDQSTLPATADAFIIAGSCLSSLRTALKDSALATKLPAK
jgi:hypothetical protein